MLLSEFFELVYLRIRLKRKSKETVRLYRQCIRQFSTTLGREAKVSDLTEDNVLLHLDRRSEMSPATRNKELAELTAMWRLATQRGVHSGWPSIEDEPEPEDVPIAWMPDELSRLLSTARKQQGQIGQIPAGRFWHALLRLMLDTGERISAAREAERSWMQGQWIVFPASVRKGKKRSRRYKLSPEGLSAIEDLKQWTGEQGKIFPWPYTRTYIWKKYKAVVKQAGLPISRKHGFHAIRKTHASILFASNVDPQESLGHSDRRTTQRYLDSRYTREQQPCDVLAAYLANPGQRNSDPPSQATG